MILCDKDGILCEGDAGLPPHHGRPGRPDQPGTPARHPGRRLGRGRCVHRRLPPRPGDGRDGRAPWPRTPSCWPWPTPCRRSCLTWPWPTGPLWWAPGRSDFPNQINNVLVFPGLFKGALLLRGRADHRGDEVRRRQGPGRHDPRRRALPHEHPPLPPEPGGGGRRGECRGRRSPAVGTRTLLSLDGLIQTTKEQQKTHAAPVPDNSVGLVLSK